MAALRLLVGCEFAFQPEVAVPMTVLARVRPDGPQRVLSERTSLAPEIPLREYLDGFGNRGWRLTAPAGGLTLRYEAVVELARQPDPIAAEAPLLPPEALPDETLQFTLPSRQVESDLLLSDAWRLFGDTPRTWTRVQAVCDWVHAHVQYDADASGPGAVGSAVGVFQRRVGVCRDFALLALAFCRALNVPARYAFGYLPDVDVAPAETPMDFHAWFEAFVDGHWYAFDARHNVPRIGRVLVGRGRDAVDAALTTAYGNEALTRMAVWAHEEP